MGFVHDLQVRTLLRGLDLLSVCICFYQGSSFITEGKTMNKCEDEKILDKGYIMTLTVKLISVLVVFVSFEFQRWSV